MTIKNQLAEGGSMFLHAWEKLSSAGARDVAYRCRLCKATVHGEPEPALEGCPGAPYQSTRTLVRDDF